MGVAGGFRGVQLGSSLITFTITLLPVACVGFQCPGRAGKKELTFFFFLTSESVVVVVVGGGNLQEHFFVCLFTVTCSAFFHHLRDECLNETE